MDYKKTLLMPQTNFKMKANLTQKEQLFRNQWLKNNVYKELLKRNETNKPFILHDGPIYANGDLHLGHAFNKILKDIVIRRKNMEGFYAPFINGWDTHGLPIELKMLEQKNLNQKHIDPIKLRKESAQFATKQAKKQKDQFLKLQLFAPLENVYYTFDKSFEVAQLKIFKKMVLSGLIYKGLKPIYWSPSSQTALAEAEIEYKNHIAPEMVVAFKIIKGNQHLAKGDFLLIMTTTPWTLIANAGVAVNEKYKYTIVSVNKQKYVVATKRLQKIAKDTNWKKYEIVASVLGKELIGIQYECPIKKKLIAPVINASFVDIETGTGLVHLAPLFGEDDYIVSKAQNLNMIMHIDDQGYITSSGDDYAGMFYEKANKKVSQELQGTGQLLSLKFIKHSYPHDWRTGKPIMYRGVPQWFVNIKPIKKNILDALKKVKSFPLWGLKRLKSMIENRDEWTISRQRTWGVPLIIFYDQAKQPVIKEAIFDYVINLVSKHGTNIWWEKTTDQLLPSQYRNQGFSREMDIMDVWFDSGSTSIAVQIGKHKPPFDLYLEGTDQYRGWFNSSLINSVAYHQIAPFKTFISHGFVLDANQEKMSKSKGNVISPMQIIQNYGADILRLWVADSEYIADVTISTKIIQQVVELYRKIRNSIKFMLGNLIDFDYLKNATHLEGLHQHINNKIKFYHYNLQTNYDNYEFQTIVKNTSKLLTDLSNWYFNYAKDILYCAKANDHERRMIQTNMFAMLKIMFFALAPILPTTIEEAYQALPNYHHQKSIFLENDIPPSQVKFNKDWVNFETKTRPFVNNLIEKKIRVSGARRSNELILHLEKKMLPKNLAKNNDLAKYLIVAKVILSDSKSHLNTFKSKKCLRCWNHFQAQEMVNEICIRCQKVLRL